MKIAICGSMMFSEKMIEMQKILNQSGHQAYTPGMVQDYVGKSDEEKKRITLEYKQKHDAVREHGNVIENADIILVLNYTKNGIENYIGGNTLIEIGYAYFLNKKIYFLNPVPKMPYCESELYAVNPIILHGDISQLLK